MRIATANYDLKGILYTPAKLWDQRTPDYNVLTLDGGYWHFVCKAYRSEVIRDIMLQEVIDEITKANGSVMAINYVFDEPNAPYGFKLRYIVESPEHEPVWHYAALIDENGGMQVDPTGRYDQIAETGQAASDSFNGKNVPNVATTFNVMSRAADIKLNAKARMLAIEYAPGSIQDEIDMRCAPTRITSFSRPNYVDAPEYAAAEF